MILMWFPVLVWRDGLKVVWGRLSRRYVWYRSSDLDEKYFKLRVPDECSWFCKVRLWWLGLDEYFRWVSKDV